VRCALVALLLASCVESPSTVTGETHVVAFDWPTHGVPQLDLLFVVDDTQAMAPYRARVLALGPYAAAALHDYTAGMPDVHIGVTTTSGAPVTSISDIHNNDGSRNTSYTGDLGDTLAAMLDVGAAGDAPQQPLEAIRRALSDTDFVRPDTNVMVVTLSAGDDHSLDSVDAYVAAVKEHTRYPITAGAYPMPSPRLDAFHTATADAWLGAYTTPLDAPGYGKAFDPITNIVIDFAEPCFEIGGGPAEPYDCSVAMVEDDVETVVPPCETTPTGACWSIVTDPICWTERGLGTTIDIRGYARLYRPHLVGQCVSR